MTETPTPLLVPATLSMEIEPGRGMVRLTGHGLVLGLTEYVLGLIDICRLENDWMPLQGVVRGPLLTDALYARILACGDFGEVQDHQTGEGIRPATPAELRDSIEAESHDGGAGVIVIDGRRCFVS